MPKVTTLFYCEDVNKNNNHIQINNPLNIFTPVYVPGMFSFSIVASILDIDENPFKIQLKFINQTNNKVLIDTNEIFVNENNFVRDPGLPDKMQGFWIDLNFKNVVLDNEGEYVTEVYLNGKLDGEFPILVKQVNNKGAK